MAAFEISAKNRESRENNKREQAEPTKIAYPRLQGLIGGEIRRRSTAAAMALMAVTSAAPTIGLRAYKKPGAVFRPDFLQLRQIAPYHINLVTKQANFGQLSVAFAVVRFS